MIAASSGVDGDVADERAVDLHASRSGSASGTRATSSRCRSRRSTIAHAHLLASRCSVCVGALRILHHHALGDLELEQLAAAARCARSHAAMSSTSRSSLNWRADRLTATRTGCGSSARASRRLCRHARVQHPAADWQIRPRLLGQRNEGSRRHQAALGMLPAHQRLDADDARRCACRSSAGSAAAAGRVSSARRMQRR